MRTIFRRVGLVLGAAALLTACTVNQGIYSAALSYDAAEKLATAAIVSGSVTQAQAARIKACDQIGYGVIAPLAAAKATGASVPVATVQAATDALATFSGCLGANGIAVAAATPGGT